MAPDPDAPSLKGAARQTLDAEQAREALGHLESAVRHAPDNKGAWVDLASLYEQAERLPEAWAAYQSAVRLAPNDLDVLAPFLGFLVRRRRVEGIMPLYNQVLSLGWRDARGMAALGNALISYFQYAEAEQVFRRAEELAPGNEVVLRGLGITLNALKRFDEAVAYLEKVADPPPGQTASKGNVIARVHLLSALGGAALSEGRCAAAADLLGEAIEIERQLLDQTVPAPTPAPASPHLIHRVLYIEVELKAREFEARALLALHAAAAGLDVVIGQKSSVSGYGYANLPAGIFLVKTMNGVDVQRVTDASAAGHMVVALDEEAFGGLIGESLWLRLATDPQVIARTDLVIAQGEEYARLLTSIYPDAAKKILVLGNPRVDLYRPEFRKDTGRARTRIVICSQSQVCNPKAISFPDLIALHVKGVPMAEDLGRRVIDGTKEVFGFELALVPQLQDVVRSLAGKWPDADILFRPHPAEDPGIWTRAFTGLANVTVSSAGSFADALTEAKAVIYVRGCSTGLEAHFQRVPIIRFDGDGRVPDPGDWISSGMGFPTRSPNDVIAALERIADGETTWEYDQTLVAAQLYGLGEGLVCPGVARALAQAAAARALPDPSARVKLRTLTGAKTRQRDFEVAKFPATDVAEVEELAARLAAAAGIAVPGIEALAPNVFLFTGAAG